MARPYELGTGDAYLIVAIEGLTIILYSTSDADEAIQSAQSLSRNGHWAAVFDLRHDQVYGVWTIFQIGQRRPQTTAMPNR